MRRWRIEDSAELYNINGWGLKYFSINEKGHIQVTPREGCAGVDLKEVMDDIGERYGLDVLFCDKSLSEQRFHCMYSVNDSLDHVLDIIKSSSDLNINVVGNTIFIE